MLCRPHNQLHAEQKFGRAAVGRGMDFRRQKSEQRGQRAESRSVFDAAMCGLKNMGFREPDARRALAEVAVRCPEAAAPMPLERLIREALGGLT